MILNWEDVLKIVLALVAGGLIGIEREARDKAAGFRTLIFICVGATLFTILSSEIAGQPDPRIAASVVTGVGFLGAGVILREQGRVVGITTAAVVWLAAAVGMCVGGGYYLLTGVVVFLALVVLWLFPLVEHAVHSAHDERVYEVVSRQGPQKGTELEGVFRQSGLHVRPLRQLKSGDTMTTTWQAAGPMKAHERLAQRLLADADVLEVRC
jgi:putative Mg2+ transporter-C (MgtC) family protein